MGIVVVVLTFPCVSLRYSTHSGRGGVGITDIPNSRTMGPSGVGVGGRLKKILSCLILEQGGQQPLQF